MSEAFERLREALKKPVSKEAMKEAASAFERYRVVKLAKGRSRPMLVSLGYKKTYPSAIPLDKIPEEIAKNPDFYTLMKKLITKEK